MFIIKLKIILLTLLLLLLTGCSEETQTNDNENLSTNVENNSSVTDENISSSDTDISTDVEIEEVEIPLTEEELLIKELESIYYYDETRLDRYLAYIEITDFSYEDVLWQVNMNVDKEFYVDTEIIDDPYSLYAIVNKHYQLPDDFEPLNLVTFPSGRYVTEDTKTAFDAMVSAAKSEGYSIGETSAYRSISLQTTIYNRYLQTDTQEEVDTYSARPGYSEHHLGTVIDMIGSNGIMSKFVDTVENNWILDNAYKYGFIVRYTEENEFITGYQAEEWHIRYVGVDVATTMREENIASLEEYVVKYVMYSK